MRRLLQDLGREPTSRELAKEMDTTPAKVRQLRQCARQPTSLDQTLGDEGDYRLGDFIEDSQAVVALDAVAFTQLQDHLRSVLVMLSEREAALSGCALAWPTANRAPWTRSATLRAHAGMGWPACRAGGARAAQEAVRW